MEINHANQLKEHVSQMNAMQNRLIAMERGQASRCKVLVCQANLSLGQLRLVPKVGQGVN
jgi:hypothetical protein